jgi:glycosyltransferase involved in cell wall biosynthesis
VRRNFPSTASRISVIPNGVEVEELRQAQPYPVSGKVILSSGRLRAYKNVHLVIEALRYLDPEYSLVVTGEGEERENLERRAGELGLSGRVRFAGRVEDDELRRWFRTASVYVTMSAQEAYGLTLAEALAAGAPVVASDIPAHREIAAANSGTGVELVPLPAAPEALARTIRRAADHPPVGAPSGILSWDDVTERVIEVYRSVLGV